MKITVLEDVEFHEDDGEVIYDDGAAVDTGRTFHAYDDDEILYHRVRVEFAAIDDPEDVVATALAYYGRGFGVTYLKDISKTNGEDWSAS